MALYIRHIWKHRSRAIWWHLLLLCRITDACAYLIFKILFLLYILYCYTKRRHFFGNVKFRDLLQLLFFKKLYIFRYFQSKCISKEKMAMLQFRDLLLCMRHFDQLRLYSVDAVYILHSSSTYVCFYLYLFYPHATYGCQVVACIKSNRKKYTDFNKQEILSKFVITYK